MKNITREKLKIAFDMAWPAMIESFFLALATIIDSYMVSGLGANAVASVGLSAQPKWFALSVFFGFNVAASALVARRRGEGNKESANQILLTAMKWTLILSLAIGILLALLADPIIRFCGSEPETHADGVTYLQVIVGCQVFTTMTNIINSAQRGAGDTKITMRTNLIASVVNICFNYLLIEGHLGFPRLGVFGAALATVLGYAVACGISIVSLYNKKRFLSIPYIIENKLKSSLQSLKLLFSVGGSVILEEILMRFGFFATAYMAAKLGTNPFAAHNVGMNLMNLSFSFGNGLQSASVALIGRSLGEKRPELARDYGNTCKIFGFSISVLLMVFYLLCGRLVFSIFFVEEEIIEYGVQICQVLAFTTFFQMQAVINAGSLRGAGDTKYPAKVCIFTVTVPRTVFSYLGAFVLGFGIQGVWFGVLADVFCRALFLIPRFRSGKWMKIVI